MEWIFLIFVVALPLIPMMLGAFSTKEKVNAFQSLGDIRGKPIDDIVAAVGPANSISALADGRSVYQWIEVSGSSSCHYAILVDPQMKALGYSHQFVS